MGEALLERLKTDAGVSAIAGANVFWTRRPQKKELPAVVLQVISGDRPQDLEGPEDMRTARVQASCFALRYGTSRQLAEAVVAAVLPESDQGEIVFWGSDADEPRDLGDPTDTEFIYHAAVDLIVRWGRAA